MCEVMASYEHILTALGNGPARRSLFGPVDREQLQQEYQNALRKDLADATQRWGFDFLSEKPLKGGDFQWERVPGTKVPLLYRPSMVGLNQVGGKRKEKVRAAPSPCGKENVPRTPEKYGLILARNLEKTPAKERENFKKTSAKERENKLKRKQTNITDFYAAKRRAVGMPRKSGQ